jgi:hypothetical protein
MEAGATAVEDADMVTVEETVELAEGESQIMEGAEVWVYTYAPRSQPAPKLF